MSDARKAHLPTDRTQRRSLASFERDAHAEQFAESARAPVGQDVPALPPAPSGPGWFGWLAGSAWAAVATAAPLMYWGAGAVLSQHPAFLGALIIIAVAPAFAILLAATAVRDATYARALAAALAAAPAPGSDGLGGEGERRAWRRAMAEAEDCAAAIVDALARERAAAAAATTALKSDVDAAIQAAGRQVRLMREASRLVAEESRAVEESFADVLAALDSDSTDLVARIAGAAEAADATRASLAAAAAHGADTIETLRAVSDAARDDARSAAEAVRSEAEAARAAIADVVAALDAAAHSARAAARDAELHAPGAPVRPRARAVSADASDHRRTPERMSSDRVSVERAETALARDLNLEWMSRPANPGVHMLETAGISPRRVLADAALAQIVRRARLGAAARRRAVGDAAPDALDRISSLFHRDDRIRAAAAAFRSDPGFDASRPMDQWRAGGDVERAYLLVDAALG